MDMHVRGYTREPPYQFIYIEAPEVEARRVFRARFGHDPGDDYTIHERDTLEAATAYDRGCRFIRPAWSLDLSSLTDERVHEALRLSRYLEPGETIPDGFVANDPPTWRDPMRLDAYIRAAEVLVVSAADIY